MAKRKKSLVATITCPADLTTVSQLAQASGLAAERGDRQHQFHLVDTGRILASELGPVLWADLTARLDRAVEAGAITQWSSVEHRSSALSP